MQTKKRKKSKAFWNNIKFKYKLTIVNENTLEEVVGLHVSKLNGISVLLSVLTVLFVIASLIVAFTPLRNYLPGYMNSEIRAQVVDNALRVDSLQRLVERQNLYIMNIQDIFRGEVKADTIQSINSLTTLRQDSLMERTQREEEFRKQYEEKGKIQPDQRCHRTNRRAELLLPHTRHRIVFLQPRTAALRNGYCRRSRRKHTGHSGRYRHPERLHCRDRLHHSGAAQSGPRVHLQALRFPAQERRRHGEGRRSHRPGGQHGTADYRPTPAL